MKLTQLENGEARINIDLTPKPYSEPQYLTVFCCCLFSREQLSTCPTVALMTGLRGLWSTGLASSALILRMGPVDPLPWPGPCKSVFILAPSFLTLSRDQLKLYKFIFYTIPHSLYTHWKLRSSVQKCWPKGKSAMTWANATNVGKPPVLVTAHGRELAMKSFATCTLPKGALGKTGK